MPTRSALILCALLVQAAPADAASPKEKQSFLKADGGKPKTKIETNMKMPWAQGKHHSSDRLQCGVTEQVGSKTDKYEDCPANCPYFAQNRKDSQHCTFLCVPGAECGRWNPNKPIPDSIKNTKTCRGPKVAFCNTPKLDGTDQCDICQSGFALHSEDGQCYFTHWTAVIVSSAFFVLLFTFVTVWFVDMCCRTPINDEAVTKTTEWRSRSKILKSRSEITGPDAKRCPHEALEVNLCTKNVAGPGMLLHFNFQMFFIIWPFCVGCVWVALACFHNELFILGTRKFGTPRHNCILVAWGYETQQRLMWTKVLFLAVVYVGSFISFLWFSVRQNRIYDRIDAKEKTMKDFAVELKGLPEISGRFADVEKDIQAAVERATGKPVIGVSVCWNYSEQQEAIEGACNKDVNRREIEVELKTEIGREPTNEQVEKRMKEDADKVAEFDPSVEYGAIRAWMYEKEKALLGPDEEEEVDVKDLLEKLVSSESAFVVFNTEEEKDEALKITSIKFDATKYGGAECALTMEVVSNEPANVNFHNFGDSDPNSMVLRFFKGLFKVYVPALLIWFFGFYCPYAWSLYNFNYDNGAELPGYYSIIFTIVVCGGNATMYVVCDICCDIIGFRYKDTKQVAYMLMYLVACMINVVLDMIVTYKTAYKVMVGLDFRTYHGTRLADIEPFTEQFETYAMQRSLGGNTYAYAWPSTFFLCFVLEPFVTILIPYQLGKMIVRTHKEIRGNCAEAYLMAFEFDMGRYADILLNVFLGILIFYFPGGYIWSLFFFMCFSHCFIYCFDHWRVLQVIPTVKIVSTQVDWWAQVSMCACCAVILACLVFKANCETYSGYCMYDMKLLTACSVAFVVHFVVHFLLLLYVVPKFGLDLEDDNRGMQFTAAAHDEARTWFSVNPVHCLRSKYIHGDKPHCLLATWGKEHLLEENHKIGCFFSDDAAETEDYGSHGLRKSFGLLGKK